MSSPDLTPPASGIALVWFEQSHFAIVRPSGMVAHIDPFLSRSVKPENHIYPEPLVEPGQVRADMVLLTHDHRDHTDPDTIRPLREANPDCLFLGPAEAIQHCLDACGVESNRCLRMAAGDVRRAGEFTLLAVYAENTSEHDRTTHLGYVVQVGGMRIYVVGDTRCGVEEYEEKLGDVTGLRPDVLLVPINPGYNNPGPEGAARLVELTDPVVIVPCHYGCFKHNTIDPREFVDALPPTRRNAVRLMQRGERLEIPRGS
jgi:L-ascorbate 6-phosphate lactonase